MAPIVPPTRRGTPVPRCGWRWTTSWTRGTLTYMTSTGVRLVVRRHVDLRRVSSAMCRRSA
ncbi:putative leader peptide [Saccharothrix longispora]|uniref:putative leader peptide n=1 Tax=Saccharothrix longispora TaxID=33920 RepID=UPI00398D48B3